LDGRTHFSRYQPFHITIFPLAACSVASRNSAGIQDSSCPITKKHHFGPLFLPGPEFARLLLERSSSLKDRGSTPLASKSFIIRYLHKLDRLK
jgi:hypothetical protein